jgi:hypothetical protein
MPVHCIEGVVARDGKHSVALAGQEQEHRTLEVKVKLTVAAVTMSDFLFLFT